MKNGIEIMNDKKNAKSISLNIFLLKNMKGILLQREQEINVLYILRIALYQFVVEEIHLWIPANLFIWMPPYRHHSVANTLKELVLGNKETIYL